MTPSDYLADLTEYAQRPALLSKSYLQTYLFFKSLSDFYFYSADDATAARIREIIRNNLETLRMHIPQDVTFDLSRKEEIRARGLVLAALHSYFHHLIKANLKHPPDQTIRIPINDVCYNLLNTVIQVAQKTLYVKPEIQRKIHAIYIGARISSTDPLAISTKSSRRKKARHIPSPLRQVTYAEDIQLCFHVE